MKIYLVNYVIFVLVNNLRHISFRLCDRYMREREIESDEPRQGFPFKTSIINK